MKFITFKRQSKLLINRLNKILEHSNTLSELPDIQDKHKQRALSLNSEAIEKQTEFHNIKDKLLNTPSSIEDEEEEELEKIDSLIADTLVDIITILRPLLPECDESDDSHNISITSHSNNSSNVRLPKIQLKTFNGDITQWIAFHNVFETTVHKNKSITNIEKFQYLLSCLQNEPFNLIKTLPLTNANYDIAYGILIKRYHNPRLLTSLHINHIIDMPNCFDVTAKGLRNFISQFNEHSSALSSLNVNIHENNPILITLLLRKFDINLRTRFETKRDNTHNLPTPQEFVAFLENECCYIENAHLIQHQNMRTPVQFTNNPKLKPGLTRNKNVSLTAQNMTHTVCSFCSSDHIIYTCNEFAKLSPSERFNFTKTHNLCVNCLGTHRFKECISKSTCKKCSKRHHTLLHLNTHKLTVPESTKHDVSIVVGNRQTPAVSKTGSLQRSPNHSHQSADNNNDTVCAVNTNNGSFTTLLGTMLVKLSSTDGNIIVVRALIDSASTCSFINTDVVNKLQLRLCHLAQRNQVNGISATPVSIKGKANVNIMTLNDKQISHDHQVLVLNKITSDMPSAVINYDVVNTLSNFKLADPNFHKKGPIQMLIGADLFMQIIKPNKYSLGENMPYALDTDFGFVIIGRTPVISEVEDAITSNHTTLHCQPEDSLHKLVSNFWTLEQPPQTSTLTEDDIKCEQHFSKTHYRNLDTGKYTVMLPFKESPDKLGESASVAKKRFFTLERKLSSQPELKQLYTEFMTDYDNAGHMTLCDEQLINKTHYFLPHHGVYKDSSSTTRLRVVFDASSKTSNGVSLNDILHVGPKLHNDLQSILTNFRRYKFVFTTDVKQMFRSIDVDKDDRNYQLIYWRHDPQQKLSIYQLNTVTYGMSSSPYLANRVILQLANDEQINFPIASKALREHIYVDDVAMGADTIEDALSLQCDIKCLLEKGGFHLRKWTANHKALLTDIPKEYQEQPVIFRTPDQPLISILGLQWIPNNDCFTYKISIAQHEVYTKRVLLSDIAKIFDPLGFLSPTVIWAKIFIQTLWTRNLEWDQPLPSDLAQQWALFTQQLPALENLTLPRHLMPFKGNNIQLHGFCDSSESAYSAAVYLRIANSSNDNHVSLVVAKTRVAPLKRISLPRLELCGAHLLAQLLSFYTNLLSKHMTIDSIYAWTDSTVTLSWISTPSYKLKTYVANRVSQIQDWLPGISWLHVPSLQNPADCATRGLFPQELIHNKLWWTGPNWLKLSRDKWPKIINLNLCNLPEVKPTSDNVLIASKDVENEFNILLKFSSWMKLQRVIAYILRFIHNTRNASNKRTGYLCSTELHIAVVTICKLVQYNAFKSDNNSLKSKNLQKLSPFKDDDGLIRVGGRLKNANISTYSKHPILLPKSHFISSLIVDYFHLKFLHAGPQLLQSLISQQFWILSARSLIRSRIYQCITCFKCKPRTAYPIMGNLPTARVNPSPCFKTSGLDFAGPFDLKIHTLRRAQIVKSYLCIFICFTTKAVHIELVSDLSKEAFLAALTRFSARRGAPTDLYLDNATNFVGASNYLNKVMKSTFQNESTSNKFIDLSMQYSTKFHFIPPSAPHQGGIWESGVKSVKTLLKRVVGERILTIEEFQTLSARIEAILNSRPLCPLSTDPTELDVLTPGHFLIGRPIVSLVEPNYEEMPLNHLKRWQAVQAMTQQLWKRWKIEYLHTLQQKNKWVTHSPNLEVNDLVLLHGNSPVQTWPLGRIVSTHPGTDGVIRVVTVRTASGVFKRPVVKVSPLPK